MTEKTVAMTENEAKDAAVAREETREDERYLSPPVDIFETEDGLTVLADLPGVSKDDLKIDVNKGILTITAKSRHVADGEPAYREYELRSYFRQFELSDRVDVEKISASLRHGVLTLTLPKIEEAKPRQIQVNVG